MIISMEASLAVFVCRDREGLLPAGQRLAVNTLDGDRLDGGQVAGDGVIWVHGQSEWAFS